MIIEYEDKYQDDVKRLIRLFHDEALAPYNGRFSYEQLDQTIRTLKETGTGLCFLYVEEGRARGLLAGVSIQGMASTKRTFQELVWYVEPDFRRYGVKLYYEGEKRLKTMGYDSVVMALFLNSMADKVKALYESMGFNALEVHYIKDI